ncbi:hypothetical protein BH24ACT1_BH24ACT1_12300 [soil metagenome]
MVQPGTEPRRSHRRLPRDRSRRHAGRSLAVAVVALLIATLSAVPQNVTTVERSLFYAVNGLSDVIEWPLWVVMQLGAALVIPVMALVAFLGWRRLRPAADVLAAGTLAWLSARVMKDALERGRPPSFFEDVKLRGSLGAGGDEGLGFPSGHATVAFALAIVVFPYIPLPWRVVTVVLATIVAFSRLYFGAHFPLDVLGGAALGIAIAASVHLALDLVTHRH